MKIRERGFVRILAPAALLCMLTLLVTACGSGSGGSGNAVTTAAPATAAGTSASVSIKNFSFDPAALTISKGTAVTWTNNDSVAHTATADGGAFDSGNLDQGKSFSFTFNQSGTFAYHCAIHPYMKAQITVK